MFVSHGHRVLFVTGKEAPHISIVNAMHAETKPVSCPAERQEEHARDHPEIATTMECKANALVPRHRVKDVDADDALNVVAIDSNGSNR